MSTRNRPGESSVGPQLPHSPSPADSDLGRPPPGRLEVPHRSLPADFLAVAALGFVFFGPGFSWLAAKSNPYESFADILWSTGIWSGLLFGVPLGLLLAFQLRPRVSSFAIESPAVFRARLNEALPRAKQAIKQEADNDLLLHPVRRPPLPILAEETLLIQISGSRVTITGGRMMVSRLRRKMGGWQQGKQETSPTKGGGA